MGLDRGQGRLRHDAGCARGKPPGDGDGALPLGALRHAVCVMQVDPVRHELGPHHATGNEFLDISVAGDQPDRHGRNPMVNGAQGRANSDIRLSAVAT